LIDTGSASSTGTLFSGDTIYDGPLIEGLPDNRRADYGADCSTYRYASCARAMIQASTDVA
jgi:hypothetical protein